MGAGVGGVLGAGGWGCGGAGVPGCWGASVSGCWGAGAVGVPKFWDAWVFGAAGSDLGMSSRAGGVPVVRLGLSTETHPAGFGQLKPCGWCFRT